MAWYSLFVLKVPLNNKQTNKQTYHTHGHSLTWGSTRLHSTLLLDHDAGNIQCSGTVDALHLSVDYASCRKQGISYRALPSSFEQPICTGRNLPGNELCNQVNIWCASIYLRKISSKELQIIKLAIHLHMRGFVLKMLKSPNIVIND